MRHIKTWKRENEKRAKESNITPNEWLFPSPRSASGLHGHSSILMQKVLHPACDNAKIPRIGWHALRHSYRTWMNSAKITAGTAKDMMRHADIATTMNVYGRTIPAEMREASNAIAGLLAK